MTHDDERNTSRNFPAYNAGIDEPDEEVIERRPSSAANRVMDEAADVLATYTAGKKGVDRE